MQEHSGQLFAPPNTRVAIVVSRFNDLVGKNLLEGALSAFRRGGVEDNHIHVYWVPGAFEIPIMTKRLCLSGRYQAVVTLGAVIRGATPHFDYVAGPMASSLAQIGVDTQVPVIFGVLTTDTLEQALERAGSKGGNKGHDSALAAMEMVSLFSQVQEIAPSRIKVGVDLSSS